MQKKHLTLSFLVIVDVFFLNDCGPSPLHFLVLNALGKIRRFTNMYTSNFSFLDGFATYNKLEIQLKNLL